MLCDIRLPENTAPVKHGLAEVGVGEVAVGKRRGRELAGAEAEVGERKVDTRRLAAAQFDPERARSGADRGRQVAYLEAAVAQHRVREIAADLRVAVVELATFEMPIAQIAAAEAAFGEAAIDEVRVREHRLPEVRSIERDVAYLEPARLFGPHDRRIHQRIAQRAGRDASVEALLRNGRAFRLRHVAGFESVARIELKAP